MNRHRLNAAAVVLFICVSAAIARYAHAGVTLGRAAALETLHVPPKFHIEVLASGVSGARFMAVAPNGDLLVAQTDEGRVVAIRPGAPNVKRTVVADGLQIPHGLAMLGDQLYIATWSGVVTIHYPVRPGDKLKTLFSDMPQGGDHNHRALAVTSDGAIFVSSGSDCNVCTESDARFATILRYDGGGHGRIEAKGLRNASGLTLDSRGKLWAVVNERDNLGDNLPPDELDSIIAGGNYGWPYCHSVRGGREPNPEFGDPSKCKGTVPPAFVFQAHSAPLAIAFYRGDRFGAKYRGALFVAFHGSWNRSVPTGYKVVALFFRDGKPESVEDFATGWLSADGHVFGRPAGLAIGKDGSLYVSDDDTGNIYKIAPISR